MLKYFEDILKTYCNCCKEEIEQKDFEDEQIMNKEFNFGNKWLDLKDIFLIIICGDWNAILDSITICEICKKSMKSNFIGFFLRGMFAGLVVAIGILAGIKFGAL